MDERIVVIGARIHKKLVAMMIRKGLPRFGGRSAAGVILSASLARACLVWLETAHHRATGQWRDPSYRVAKQDGSLFVCLGFPTTQFLKQGLI